MSNDKCCQIGRFLVTSYKLIFPIEYSVTQIFFITVFISIIQPISFINQQKYNISFYELYLQTHNLQRILISVIYISWIFNLLLKYFHAFDVCGSLSVIQTVKTNQNKSILFVNQQTKCNIIKLRKMYAFLHLPCKIVFLSE